MGDIKSTLDLVMERTRHLSLSAEEKTRQQRDAFQKRLNGLLQQYADDALAIDALQDRIAALQSELQVTDPQALLQAVFSRIDPENSNRRWLDLVAELMPAARQGLEEVLADCRQQQTDLLQVSEQRLQDRFARHHGISGSALQPNPQKDHRYRESLAELHQSTRSRIEALLLRKPSS